MAELALDVARKILDAALAKAVEKKFKPLVITVLDARGCVKVTAAQDGTSLMRAEIAQAPRPRPAVGRVGPGPAHDGPSADGRSDRKSTRLNSSH